MVALTTLPSNLGSLRSTLATPGIHASAQPPIYVKHSAPRNHRNQTSSGPLAPTVHPSRPARSCAKTSRLPVGACAASGTLQAARRHVTRSHAITCFRSGHSAPSTALPHPSSDPAGLSMAACMTPRLVTYMPPVGGHFSSCLQRRSGVIRRSEISKGRGDRVSELTTTRQCGRVRLCRCH
ncbi:hypothetical protein BDV95DRAFT_347433 [Massariosphaeria phaeospora]|uniref:Uncharacterized protein n=1 Tax=Massariosphaeria phaeospora TaxID=100035 RepID=A0A7C8MNJ9_9PLEO|nr:hypothetical protein BDV95DRAFT_347433 [Massariosphaeria phaeospora]